MKDVIEMAKPFPKNSDKLECSVFKVRKENSNIYTSYRTPKNIQNTVRKAQKNLQNNPNGYFVSANLTSSYGVYKTRLPKQIKSFPHAFFANQDRYTTQSNNLYVMIKGKEKRIGNFILIPIAKINLVSANTMIEEQIEFTVSTENKQTSIRIPRNRIASAFSLIKETMPQITLDTSTQKADGYLSEYIANILDIYESTLPTKTIYIESGWALLNDGPRYLSGNDANCLGELKLPDITRLDKYDIYSKAMKILTVAEESVIVPLFLHAHAGFSGRIFRDAQHPIQYIMDIIGISGSRKTSLASILYSLYKVDNKVNFTSTTAGFERIASKLKDNTILLDDLADVNNKDNLAKFESFLRQVGDSTGRAKTTNGGEDIVRTNMEFSVVMTAEEYFHDLSRSSKLRNIAVFIDRDTVNNTVLQSFQDDVFISAEQNCGSILENYMVLFIRFLEEHYSSLKHQLYTLQLSPNPIIKEARLEESRRALNGLAMLVVRCGLWVGYYDNKTASAKLQHWSRIIDNLIQHNQLLINQCAPHLLFLQGVTQLRAVKKISIAENKEAYQVSPSDYVGFFDYQNDEVRLFPPAIMPIIRKYYKQQNIDFNRSDNDIFKMLRIEGYSIGYKDASHKSATYYKKVMINGESLKFLALSLSKIKEINNIY